MKADGKPDTLGVDTMWVWTPRADGKDTLLVNRLCGTSATSLELPISYTQPEDVLCLLLADTVGRYWLDSIRIKKENHPHFESVDCQAAFFHTITGVTSTHNIVDSVVIKNPEVTYDASSPHFYLYLKARR
ncbi:MAG: alpha amylase [Prevotella sp.]|nr:alpha amylase [Prevotella sp.]